MRPSSYPSVVRTEFRQPTAFVCPAALGLVSPHPFSFLSCSIRPSPVSSFSPQTFCQKPKLDSMCSFTLVYLCLWRGGCSTSCVRRLVVLPGVQLPRGSLRVVSEERRRRARLRGRLQHLPLLPRARRRRGPHGRLGVLHGLGKVKCVIFFWNATAKAQAQHARKHVDKGLRLAHVSGPLGTS